MLRFKVISSIQQPEALHCQRTTSFLLTHAPRRIRARTNPHMHTNIAGIFYSAHLPQRLDPTMQSASQVKT